MKKLQKMQLQQVLKVVLLKSTIIYFCYMYFLVFCFFTMFILKYYSGMIILVSSSINNG